MTETKFKKSEVGLIPEDWEINAIGSIAVILNGSTPPTVDPANYGNTYLFVSPADLGSEKYVIDTIKKLSSKGFSISRNFPKGSILYTCTGSTIGKCGIAGCDLTSNQQINAILPNNSYNNEYLYYALQPREKEIKSNASVQAVPLINKNTFSKTLVAFPATKEQSRIAEALSDIDDLISTTKKLIEKKRNIKEGSMQDLLSGKRRLPEFKEKWVKTNVGSVTGKISRGQTLISDNFCFGNIPVMAGGKQYAGFHNVANQKGRTITISGSGASAGFVCLHKTPIFATDCSVISDSKNYSLDFLFYILSAKQEDLYKLQTGGAQPHVYPRDIEKIEISIPQDTKEQSAIADVLSDMDSEIQSLKARLTKYQSLKQGMMQQLLTGKIRLI